MQTENKKPLTLIAEVRSHTQKNKVFTLYGKKGDKVTVIKEIGGQVAVDNGKHKFWTYKNNVTNQSK